MRSWRGIGIGLLSGLLSLGVAQAQQDSEPVRSEQATARLLVHAPEGVGAGKTIWAGLALQHAAGWHTYWRNPGDSGLPTRLNWTLPAGAQAGDIHWPVPHKLPLGPLVNYGFEGELLLPVTLKLPAELPAGKLKLGLRAEWLVCKDVCIPEQGEFQLELPQGQALNDHAFAFKNALAAEPQALKGVQVQARQAGDALQLDIQGLPAAWRGRAVEAFGSDAGVYDHARPEQASWQGERLNLMLPLSPQQVETPAELELVLRAGEQTGSLRFALAGGWQANPGAAVTAAPVEHLGGAAPAAPASGDVGLLAALAFAFMGGLILNLMPCVFPVLSLKALALVREAPHERHVGAAAYTAGVVLSFLLLAGLLLGLRAAGDQIGWGFQLQSPAVVAGLAGLFTLIALNLFGVFEFGNWLPSGVAGWRAQRPWLDQAATGVLSVAVASPCTAPFMGAALGAALTLPPVQSLAVFAALGLGMAAPYVSFALVPGLAARLPRPGAWMERLRHVLGFPMLATVLWLVWVLGQQAGLDAAVALLVLLLALAYGLWAWALKGLAWRISAALVLLLGVLWAAPSLHQPAGAPAAMQVPAAGWGSWSPEAQQAAIASGKPLFVDFTAAWCITCQYNKRNALSDSGVLADFEAAGVQRLRADWTLRDAAITEELRRLGRSGVPVYVLYTPGRAEPELMPEILAADTLRARLQSLPR